MDNMQRYVVVADVTFHILDSEFEVERGEDGLPIVYTPNDKFDFSHIAEYVDIEDLVEVSNES
jgi:hypothetical protein